MAGNAPDVARSYHERTKHSVESVYSGGYGLDWANLPIPVKHYPDLEPLLLPLEFPESDRSAVEVLSGRHRGAAAGLDLPGLARLLFCSAGVTRRARIASGRPIFFRAAPSAGALYPVEAYVVCGDLPGLDAGVYHFGPVESALRRLRSGDQRAYLAVATSEPAIGGAPATVVLTGIPWRTCWKYGERGYRHLFWDSGTILANLLAAADAVGLPARVLLGFVDDDVSRLLDLGDPEEYPLAVVPLGTGDPPAGTTTAERPSVEPLGHRVHPLSARPVPYPLVGETQRAGCIQDPVAVAQWREAVARLEVPDSTADPAHPVADGGTVEDVIVRRGSTRRYSREASPSEALTWALAAATRPVASDFAWPGRTLLVHGVAVHAIHGVEPGAYWWTADGRLQQRRAGDVRAQAAHLCLDQALGGDAAYVAFHLAGLKPVLETLGSRGYRAAQLEAGIVAGRLHLAAYALGLGASGITFFDDEVAAFFGATAQPMLTTTVGVPAYRARPGKRPSEVERLRVQLGDSAPS